jgi:O-antigen/teichoic acid export membrane protein
MYTEEIVFSLRWVRSSFFGGLSDQAIVSLGNFGLNIALARNFAEHEYGAFSFILSFALFLNTLHQAFVTYPLSVHGAPAERGQFDYFLAIATALTFVEALLFFPVISGAALSVRHPDLVPIACCFLLTWQLQEVYRRGLLARARFAAATANDFARYIVTLAAIMALTHYFTLSLQNAFLLLTAGSLLTCCALLPASAAQLPAALRNISSELRGHWHMAAPVLGANLLAAFSTQWFLWLLAWSRDLSSSAALVALANIVAFSSPVMYGIENILVPEIARLKDGLTHKNLMSLLMRRGLAGGALVLPFFLIVIIWPGPTLHLFYGHHKTYAQFTLALQALGVAYITYLASYIFSATLRGYRATGAVFKMQLYPALLAITLGSWLTLHFGVTGACFAAMVAGFMRACIGYYFVNGLREQTAQNANVPVLNVTS